MVNLRYSAGKLRTFEQRRSPFWLALLVTGFFLVFSTGCEDPSNVGLGLVSDEDTDPEQVTIAASGVEQTSLSSVTGNRGSVVVGRVSDPLFGTVSAAGYVDLRQPTSFPDSFEDDANEISSVILKLHRTYLYGDTTGTMPLVLHSMPSDWPAANVSADTTLTAGSEITSLDVSPTDSLVEIEMPDEWIDEHQAALRGTDDFAENFHGFQISSPDARAVQGFSADTSALEVTIDDETVDFPISKELATISRSEQPSVPDNRVALQSAGGPAVSLTFALDEDRLENQAVSRARIVLPIDREVMQQRLPEGFVRPLPEEVIVYGVDDEGTRTPLGVGELEEENNRYVIDSRGLANIFQQIVLGTSDFERYIVAGSTQSQVTVSSALLYNQTGETRRPSITLTVVSLE